jgi:hypothetical protein
MINLMTEGMLTAKHLFPNELSAYEFDEIRYLRSTMHELRKREMMGVDVSTEIADALRYSGKYQSLEKSLREITASVPSEKTFVRSIRSMIGKLLGMRIRTQIHALKLRQKLRRGYAHRGFEARGDDFGFSNILECSKFLERWVATPNKGEWQGVLARARNKSAAKDASSYIEA